MAITLLSLLKQTLQLAKDARQATDAHNWLATKTAEEAKDTSQVAEQIAALKVDAATIAETREVSRTMDGLSQTAKAYATAASEASRAADAAHKEAKRLHGGIKEAVDRSPVRMAKAIWYSQN